MKPSHTTRTLLATVLLTTLGASSAWAQASEMSSGEIRKVDKAANKITIRHGEIKNLDMPPMTMVFQGATRPCWRRPRQATRCASARS